MSIKAPSIRRSLDEALRDHPLPPRGHAAVALAKRLASDLDDATDPDVVTKLSGRYLAVLEALGMTLTKPAAAGTPTGGTDDQRPVLDQLRERRARLRDAAAVDATAP